MADIFCIKKIIAASLLLIGFFSGMAAGLPDAQLKQVADGFDQRREAIFNSDKGKPLVRGKIDYEWRKRGDFTRHYGQSIVFYAMRCFYLNEQIDQANAAIEELCKFHVERPQTLLEIHSFPSFSLMLVRIYEMYGTNGTAKAGLLKPQVEAVLLDTLWIWSKSQSKITDAEFEKSKTWNIENSENHHAQHITTAWAFTGALKDAPKYKDLAFDDGFTAPKHYQAWSEYFKHYLSQRGKKGMEVEIASPSYNLATLKCVYNVHDFAEDAVLKRLAKSYIDLNWALWAQEQIDAVRGGGKARCYPASSQGGNDFNRRAVWYYLGIGDAMFKHAEMLTFATSTYRMPPVIMDIALDVKGRGDYEISERRIGLVDPEFNDPHQYRLRPDESGIHRYSYCTPEFIIGTLMTPALPVDQWARISSQNRWQGVIFAGDTDARIYAQCETPVSSYNQQWSVQKKGTQIVHKLAANQNAKDVKVWFSNAGLSNFIEEDGWIFVETKTAWCAVKPVNGGYQWQEAAAKDRGKWLKCLDQWTPVIIEVAKKRDYREYKLFRDKIKSLPLKYEDKVLTYTGIYGDTFTMYCDYSKAPEINGKPVDYKQEKVFDSPFIQSTFDSGKITISKDKRKIELDFNL